MKAKLLLCMMVLGVVAATAQLPQSLMPRVLDDGFYLMPTPHPFQITPIKFNEIAITNMAITTTKRTKAQEDEPSYQVDFVLDFDTESQMAVEIRLFNKEMDIHINRPQKGSNEQFIPLGTYDIIVRFYTTADGIMPCVIREQVTVDHDMTMNFASSEAKNHIHFQTLTIDGEPVYTGKYAINDGGNLVQIEQGNTDDVLYLTMLHNKDYGEILPKTGNFGAQIEGYNNPSGEDVSDIYINDVSDRYSFYSYRCAIQGHAAFTWSSEVHGASDNITVTNDPTKYKLFEDPFIPIKHQGEELYPSFEIMSREIGARSWSGLLFSFTSPLTEGEVCQYFIGASPNDSQVGYVPYLIPRSAIKETVMMPWGLVDSYNPVLIGMPLTNTNDEIVFANNGPELFSQEYSEELDEYGRDIKIYPHWPTHPVFTYSVEKKKEVLGNNCPVLVTNPLQYELTYNQLDANGNTVEVTYCNMQLGIKYLGRYGETKDDANQADILLKVDGLETITAEGAFSFQPEALINGVVDATIMKESVIVDGIDGSNKAQLHYTAGADDETPPTMTMLHFKATNGDVTDRFASADEGSIEFAAGDFNFVLTPQNRVAYDRYAPESVEVSYSPYGEDNWNELVVEEVPENYWPVMGWFYSGSLAGVTGEGLNGWFDLKIRLTDAAGNWQEQVLSPAFRIDDLAYSSVATIAPNDKSDNAIYNLAGQRMRGDLNSLPHGVYIVGGKKVVK